MNPLRNTLVDGELVIDSDPHTKQVCYPSNLLANLALTCHFSLPIMAIGTGALLGI
jgi:hypothetical protein